MVNIEISCLGLVAFFVTDLFWPEMHCFALLLHYGCPQRPNVLAISVHIWYLSKSITSFQKEKTVGKYSQHTLLLVRFSNEKSLRPA
jgi:hypothetical protein